MILTRKNSPEHYSSTTTLPHARTDNLPLKNYSAMHPTQDTLPAHRQAFNSEWQRSSLAAEQRAITTREAVERSYIHHARMLPGITVGSKVALQNNETKRWDIILYGTVTDIGPCTRTEDTSLKLRVDVFLSKTGDFYDDEYQHSYDNLVVHPWPI